MRFLPLNKSLTGPYYDVLPGGAAQLMINPLHITEVRPDGDRTVITLAGSGATYTLSMPLKLFVGWLAKWSPQSQGIG